tara:strand:+ start:1675 stop:2520 length:846 start_codon:yes stop_codon:yes gene_type:complete
MSFFDQKQEVMDIQLTQFGKNLLSRGAFKPVYYQFFDDDILYNASYANIEESQNDAETRILKETPRLKTLYLTFPIHQRYAIEQKQIEDGERERFEPLKKTVIPEIQERILLYPMANQEVGNQSSPKFDVLSHEAPIKEVIAHRLTSAGIQKNVPILKTNPTYKLIEDRKNITKEKTIIGKEDFVDILSDEVIFSDNSKLKVTGQNLVIDVEELNCFTGLGNFYLNVYEVSKESSEEDETLIKIDTMKELQKYFTIKVDNQIENYSHTDPESKNYYKRGET